VLKELSVSVLVSTSYKYRELIDGFLYFFEKYWSYCELEVFVTLEKEIRVNFDNINFITSNSDDWSMILHNALKEINTKYVILLLDDYFLSDFVYEESLVSAINEMNKHSIDYLSFTNSNLKQTKISEGLDYELFMIDKNVVQYDYFIGAAHIYNRESLKRILRKKETAWEFESYASLRAILNKNFISSRYITHNSPIKYVGGGVIMKGRIREEARRFLDFEQYNLVFSSKEVSVSTEETPIPLRLLRKIIRPVKMVFHLYFGHLK
jgi:hypothetical protein